MSSVMAITISTLYCCLLLFGILLLFSSVSACDSVLREETGTITSPNYPGIYPSYSDCTIYISVPYASSMRVTFDFFDMERCCDYLYYGVGQNNDVNNAIGTLGGTSLPDLIDIPAGVVWFRFTSDGSVEYMGFSLTYTITIAQNTTDAPSTAPPTTTQKIMTTAQAPPSAVTNLIITPTATSLDVEWDAVDDADLYLVSYQLTNKYQCDTSGGDPSDVMEVEVSDTTIKFTDLHPHSTYEVTIKARNDAGESPETTKPGTTSVGPIPDKVTNLRLEMPTDSSLDVKWNRPTDTGPGCTYRYIVQYRFTNKYKCGETQEEPAETTTTALSTTLGNLFAYTIYEVKVQVMVESLSGDFVTATGETSQDVPAIAPPNLRVFTQPKSLAFTWDVIDCIQRRGRITLYGIELKDENDVRIEPKTTPGPQTFWIFSSLTPFKTYTFRLRAKNAAGFGDFTEAIVATTDKDAPPTPTSLVLLNSSTKSISFQWSPPTNPHGILQKYMIQYKTIENPFNTTWSISESEPSSYENMTHDNNQATYTYEYDSLEQGVSIELFIRAENDVGVGGPARMIFSTEVKDPSIEFPKLKLEIEDDALVLKNDSEVSNYQHVRKYLVVVNTGKDEVTTAVLTNYTTLLKDYKSSNKSYYIVAALDSFPSTFTIGDNQTIDGYYNPTFEEDDKEADVTVHVGYVFEIIQGNFTFISIGVQLKDPSSNAGLAAGVGTACAVIAAIVVVIIVVVKTRKGTGKPAQHHHPQPHVNQHFVLELDVNVPNAYQSTSNTNAKKQYISPDDDKVYDVPNAPKKPPAAATLKRGTGALIPTLPHRHRQKTIVPWSYFHIESGTKLGKGSFGEVYFGYVYSERLAEWQLAAVKVLKANAPPNEEKAFEDEFETMQKLGYHKHVVSLLAGAKDDNGIFHVAIELAPHGNLRKYLRRYRKSRERAVTRASQMGDDEQEDIPELTMQQMMSFALQVVKGMLHLEAKKVIHRDLAARNVLLGEEDGRFVVKVADFGLARDDTYYTSTGKTRVATRWQSLESLLYKKYTHKSDVWSFGVLLWEILTLGSTPYQDLDKRDVYRYLQEGNRLPQPDGCSDEIYHLMWNCWKEEPELRPTFDSLKTQLTDIMERRDQDSPYMNWTPQMQAINEDRDDN